jgi:hypothetical protein
MPDAAPPAHFRPRLNHLTLPAGTVVWRVTSADATGPWSPFVADDHFGGGRFDPVASDPFPYCYLGRTETTALVETLLRGLKYRNNGGRLLQRAAVRGRRLTSLRTTRDLQLVSLLTGPDLAAACQDSWLVHAEAAEFGRTRRWGRWLRAASPHAAGLVWPSKRDIGGTAILLYGDPGRGADSLADGPVSPRALDDAAGAAWLTERLAPYRVSVRPPRPVRRPEATTTRSDDPEVTVGSTGT